MDFSFRRWWRNIRASKSQKDWRRVTHSAKVGLALALVSLCVLLQDVFDKLGENAVWAILTVVVIFEYTVGATLSRGLNRGLGTFLAASLGLCVGYMANFLGAKAEPFAVGFSIFIVGMLATYTRSLPSVKAKYDYGVMIFLLTFCLVVTLGYKVSNDLDVVFARIVTVLVGFFVCVLVSIFIFPVWAGDELHQSVVNNFQGLASSLEECLKEYFQGVRKLSRMSSTICKEQPFDDKIYKGYRGVLMSKQTDESLGNFAIWEPRHIRFGRTYPWKRLVEVGALLRHCAYVISALHGCVLSEIQAPESLKKVFATSCVRVGEELASVLRGAAADLKANQKTKPKKVLLHKVHLAIEDLNHVVRTYSHFIYTTCLQNRDSSYSNHAPNPDSNINETSCSSQEAASNLSCDSPRSSHCNVDADSHTDAVPDATSHVDLGVPIPSSPNYQISSSIPNSDSQVGKEAPTSNGLQPSCAESLKEDKKEGFLLNKSMDFAGSLSLASLISLLIEIVGRIEHLLDANAVFQDQAGFKQVADNEETSRTDTRMEVQ